MLKAKLNSRQDAAQTIMEGLWANCFATGVIVLIEGVTVKNKGYDALTPENLAIAVLFGIGTFFLYKRNLIGAYLLIAAPFIHLAINFTTLTPIFTLGMLYFSANALRGVKLFDSLPEAPDDSNSVS